MLSLADFRAPTFSLSVTRDDVGLEDEFELFMQFFFTPGAARYDVDVGFGYFTQGDVAYIENYYRQEYRSKREQSGALHHRC